MSITYDWSITETTYEIATGGIILANWQCVGTHEDGTTADTRGAQRLKYDASSPDFIAYSDVTETTVLDWVKARLDTAEIETTIALDIEELQHPVYGTGLPWS